MIRPGLASNVNSSNQNINLFQGPISIKETFANYSDFIAKLAESTFEINEIVFIKNVLKTDESDIEKRGTFLIKVKEGDSIHCWKEILLGTHTHSNIDVIESIPEANIEDSEDKKYLVANSDGSLSWEKVNPTSTLPELPEYFKKSSDEEEINLSYSESSRLDLPLDIIGGKDWSEINTLDPVSCAHLYNSLETSGGKLFIDLDSDGRVILLTSDDLPEGDNKVRPYLSLDINFLNLGANSIDGTSSVASVNNVFYTTTFKCSHEKGEEHTEHLFFFGGNEKPANDIDVSILQVNNEHDGEKTVDVLLRKSFVDNMNSSDKVVSVTILSLHNYDSSNPSHVALKGSIYSDENFSLAYLNTELVKLQMKGWIASKPIRPKLYLSTDSEGKINWENTLLPSQLFYHIKKSFTEAEFLEKKVENEFVVSIGKIKYNSETDAVITSVNELVISSAYINNTNSSDTNIHIPISNTLLSFIEGNVTVSVLIVKNSVAGSLFEEFTEKYLTKEEAIDLLSNGKLNLGNYVEKKDLKSYSRVGHTHSQYSKKNHEHDERYALYTHTHPELLLVNGTEVEEKEELLNSISERTSAQLLLTLESLGFAYRQATIESSGKYSISPKDIISNDVYFDIYTETVITEENIQTIIEKIPSGTVYIKNEDETWIPIVESSEIVIGRTVKYTERVTSAADDADRVNERTFYVVRYRLDESLTNIVKEYVEVTSDNPSELNKTYYGNLAGINGRLFYFFEDDLPSTQRFSLEDKEFLTVEGLDTLEKDLIDSINNKIKELDSSIEPLPDDINLSEALKMIVLLLDKDSSDTSEISLDSDLPVHLNNGSIGGLVEEKTYKKNTKLREILDDILNPHINLEEMRDILTPDSSLSKIEFFVRNINPKSFTPVSEIRDGYDVPSDIYYKVDFRNRNDLPCESYYNDKQYGEQKQLIIPSNSNYDGKFYFYKNEKPSELGVETINIPYTTKEGGVFYDNYKLENGFLNGYIVKENYEFNVSFPDAIIGSERKIFFSERPVFQERVEFVEGEEFSVYIRQDLDNRIRIEVSGYDQKQFFEKTENIEKFGKLYNKYTYVPLVAMTVELSLRRV